MAEELKPTREEEAALDRIDTALSGPRGGVVTATAADFDAGNACEIYRSIRDESCSPSNS